MSAAESAPTSDEELSPVIVLHGRAIQNLDPKQREGLAETLGTLLGVKATAASLDLRPPQPASDEPEQESTTGQEAQEGEIITVDDMKALSSELWNTEVYAEVANYFLGHRKAQPTPWQGVVYEDDKYTWMSPNGKYHPIVGDTGLPRDFLEARATEVWNELHSPYELTFKHGTPPPRERWRGKCIFRMVAGPMTRNRLADYLESRALDQHCLSGTIGKAYDVLGILAGVRSRGDTAYSSAAEYSFVSGKEFEERLASSSLSKIAKTKTYRTLYHCIKEQIETGQPSKHGEMVIEGWYGTDPNNHNRQNRFEKVAAESLHELGASIFPHNAAARNFLDSFV